MFSIAKSNVSGTNVMATYRLYTLVFNAMNGGFVDSSRSELRSGSLPIPRKFKGSGLM